MTNYLSNGMKVCTQCGQCKPLVDFNRRKASRDGLSAYCKECKKKYSEAYYGKHKREYYLRNKRRREANPALARVAGAKGGRVSTRKGIKNGEGKWRQHKNTYKIIEDGKLITKINVKYVKTN